MPIPKYDSAQNSYTATVSQNGLALRIPITSSDPERTGSVLDYISYLGYGNVIPVLQEALCYKGMRDEDSIEMMSIMLDSETLDLGICAGLTNDFMTALSGNEIKGKKEFMSTYEKQKKNIEKNMEKLLDNN